MIRDEERRPGVGTEAADEDRAKSLDNKVPEKGDNDDRFDGPDDPWWRAASLLADYWEPALRKSFQLGYEVGYAAGFWAAEREMAQAWGQMAGRVRATLSHPTHDELRRRRGESA